MQSLRTVIVSALAIAGGSLAAEPAGAGPTPEPRTSPRAQRTGPGQEVASGAGTNSRNPEGRPETQPPPAGGDGGWIEFKGASYGGTRARYHVRKGKALDEAAVMKKIQKNPVGAMMALESKMARAAMRPTARTRYRIYLASAMVDGGLNPGTAVTYVLEGLSDDLAAMLSSQYMAQGLRQRNERGTRWGPPEVQWQPIGLGRLVQLTRAHMAHRLRVQRPGAAGAWTGPRGAGGWVQFHGPGWDEADACFGVHRGRPRDMRRMAGKVRQDPFLVICGLESNMIEARMRLSTRAAYRASLARILEGVGFDPGAAIIYAKEGLSSRLARMLFSIYAAKADRAPSRDLPL